MRRLLALAAAPLALLLTGCFDFTEEVHVHRDHSARVTWTYGFDERDLGPDQVEAFKRDFEESARELAGREGVSGADSRYALDDGLHQFTLDVSLTHYRSVEGLQAQARRMAVQRGVLASEGVSPIRFEELEGGKLRFVRQLAPEGESFRKAAAAATALRALRGDQEPRQHRMTFRLHAPRIEGAEGATALGGASAEWSYTFEDEEVPAALTAQVGFAPAVPWGLVFVGAGAAAGFVWLRRKWQRRWE